LEEEFFDTFDKFDLNHQGLIFKEDALSFVLDLKKKE
jgi:hypothetical protein